MEEPTRPASLLDRFPRVSVAACLAIGLILRVVALLDLKRTLYFDYLLWDEKLFHIWAAKIADGTFQSTDIYEASPLPAYLMGLVYYLFSIDPTNIRIMNIGFGLLTCLLVYLIGKQLADHKVGLVACLLACLYKPFIFYSIVPLKTAIGVFLFAVTIYCFLATFKRVSWLSLFLLGLAAALLFNVRPNAGVLVPLMPLLILICWNRQQTSTKTIATALVFYAVGIGVVLFPIALRNYLVANQWALSPSQSGFNLYLGNNLENPDPFYRPVPFANTSPYVQGIQFTVEASKRLDRKLDSAEASSYWSGEVIRVARENPAAFTRKIFQKTLIVFNQFEAGDHYHIGFMSKFVPFFKIPLPGLWLILPLGLTGFTMTFFRSQKSWTLGLILLVYAATMVIFFCNTRYRLPLAVCLIPMAVIGAERLIFFCKTRSAKKIVLWIVICASFTVLEFLPVRATDDMTAYYNTHALVLNSRGFSEEAKEYWEMSSQMDKPYSAFANFSLAQRYFRIQRIPEAQSYLDKIPDDSFSAALKYAFIGDIRMNDGEVEEALAAYNKSLEINSAQLRIHQKRIEIYEKIHPERVKPANDELKYTESFYDSVL